MRRHAERQPRPSVAPACPPAAPPDSASDRPRPRATGGAATSERELIACGIVGLLMFPIACAAALGRIISPIVFVFTAIGAITLFYRSLTKLEPADC